MELILNRIAKRNTYTIGKLYIDNQYFCDTIEDVDRGLTQSMSTTDIAKKKVKHCTAIPTGTYKVDMNTVSPKYSSKTWYMQVCKGKLPRLLNVPGFDGVLMHCGNTANDTSGCIIVGKNTIVGRVTNSRIVFKQLYQKLNEAVKNNQTVTITIK